MALCCLSKRVILVLPLACRFDLGTAAGPHRLDHGEVMYAPNVCADAQARRAAAGAGMLRALRLLRRRVRLLDAWPLPAVQGWNG